MENEAIDLPKLGKELKRLRLKKGKSQGEVAESLGIHRNSVSRYEAGSDMPAMLFLRLLVVLDGNIPEILERILKS